jgi:hypothetical protein
MSLSHICKKTAVAPELARAYTVRAEMANLVANFQYYIMFEVLAACWSQFNEAVKASVDLDGIVAAHEDYVRKLVLATVARACAVLTFAAVWLRRRFWGLQRSASRCSSPASSTLYLQLFCGEACTRVTQRRFSSTATAVTGLYNGQYQKQRVLKYVSAASSPLPPPHFYFLH